MIKTLLAASTALAMDVDVEALQGLGIHVKKAIHRFYEEKRDYLSTQLAENPSVNKAK
jgi:hypothetical protein